MVIIPDEASVEAKGPNPLDSHRSDVSARSGRSKGLKLAEDVKNYWE